jgi:hypothetical protein
MMVNAHSGLPGFTDFDPLAMQSPGYLPAMQEAGPPITLPFPHSR